MNFPAPRREPQPTLWPDAFDRPVPTPGAVRGVVGRFFESAASSLLDLPALVPDCRFPLCPDFIRVRGTPHVLYECKATVDKKILIYNTAWTKYREAVTAGYTVMHLFWSYPRLDRKDYRFESDWYSGIAAKTLTVYLVTMDRMAELLSTTTMRMLNDGVRSSTGRTGMGWALPLKKIIETPCGVLDGLSALGKPLPDVRCVTVGDTNVSEHFRPGIFRVSSPLQPALQSPAQCSSTIPQVTVPSRSGSANTLNRLTA